MAVKVIKVGASPQRVILAGIEPTPVRRQIPEFWSFLTRFVPGLVAGGLLSGGYQLLTGRDKSDEARENLKAEEQLAKIRGEWAKADKLAAEAEALRRKPLEVSPEEQRELMSDILERSDLETRMLGLKVEDLQQKMVARERVDPWFNLKMEETLEDVRSKRRIREEEHGAMMEFKQIAAERAAVEKELLDEKLKRERETYEAIRRPAAPWVISIPGPAEPPRPVVRAVGPGVPGGVIFGKAGWD